MVIKPGEGVRDGDLSDRSGELAEKKDEPNDGDDTLNSGRPCDGTIPIVFPWSFRRFSMLFNSLWWMSN